jgi:signal transduction histidine kinase
MWRRLSLGRRVYSLLVALVFVAAAGGATMLIYIGRMDRLLTAIIDDDTAAFEAAQALENALINQRGFVTYYFLDGDPEWLRRLGEYRQLFRDRLRQAQSLAGDDAKRDALGRIGDEYDRYIEAKDRVIQLYAEGLREEGAQRHWGVRQHFFHVLDLCEAYKKLNKDRMVRAKKISQEEARRLRVAAVLAIALNLLTGGTLALVLARNILGPMRRLARETGREGDDRPREDEMAALTRGVRGLIENRDQARSELERSREHLLQTEKMAMVGKLAAGMAHSIRNPFTSIQMRLFSLGRSLDLTETQKEDFEVIAHEIRHVDTIVGNFLEFSRPPKLRMQRIGPSVVVDMALQLLEQRLRSYDVEVRLVRGRPLPEVEGDPEQLKEVLVNLIVNACEAMERKRGGTVAIGERLEIVPRMGRVAVIRVTDNGPGISPDLTEKIFQPFFTTREEGTGLGLSIARRIVTEHRGALDVESREGEGATFVVALPVAT